jgi:hypothetical protein
MFKNKTAAMKGRRLVLDRFQGQDFQERLEHRHRRNEGLENESGRRRFGVRRLACALPNDRFRPAPSSGGKPPHSKDGCAVK